MQIQRAIKTTYFLCLLIINKPQPNLHSRDTSIQGTLSLLVRVSPEYKGSTVLLHQESKQVKCTLLLSQLLLLVTICSTIFFLFRCHFLLPTLFPIFCLKDGQYQLPDVSNEL